MLSLISGWPSCFIYLQMRKSYTLLWQFISSLFHCPYCTKAFLRSSLNMVMQFEPTTSCFIFHRGTSQIILLFFLAVGFYIWRLLVYSASPFSSGWSTPIHSNFLNSQVICISNYSCTALVLAILPSSAQYSTLAKVSTAKKVRESTTYVFQLIFILLWHAFHNSMLFLTHVHIIIQ